MARLNAFHEGSCGPCRLCMETVKKYTHVQKLSENEYSLLLKVESVSIDKSACICYSCSKQIKRSISNNPNFQPRWKPKIVKETLKCSIHICNEKLCKTTKLASVEEIEEVLQQKVACFTVEDDQVAVGLCRDHYNTLYTTLHPPHRLPCESCKIKPHKGQHFNRHCTSPDVVNAYLREVINYPSDLSRESILCLSCYMHFSMGILETSSALLSFLRLVGCAYFKKHTSAFEHPTPIALYQSIGIVNPLKHHEEWLQVIRKTIWLRADTESHNLPSIYRSSGVTLEEMLMGTSNVEQCNTK